MSEFDVMIFGSRGVGKSAFLKRHLTGEFEPKHIPTEPYSKDTRLVFYTNYGEIAFNMIEASYMYDDPIDALISFYSVTSFDSYLTALYWHRELQDNSMPRVTCGNKCDLPSVITIEQKMIMSEACSQYYDVSAKSNYNYEKPFLYLARQLTGCDDLMFVAAPPLEPPVVDIPDHMVNVNADANVEHFSKRRKL